MRRTGTFFLLLFLSVATSYSYSWGFDLYIGDGVTTRRVAQDTGGISAMSDNGRVTFTKLGALFTKFGTTTTLIADLSIFPGGISIGPFAVNNDGAVAFFAKLDPNGSVGLFVGDGATTTKIADGVFDATEAAINNAGVVVFRTTSGIFIGPNPITRVVGIGDTVLGTTVTAVGNVDLNDRGQISFVVGPANAPPMGPVFRATPGPSGYKFDKIAADGFTPSINNAGQVAFLARTTPSELIMFVGDGTTLTAVATTNKDALGTFRFADFGSTPVINDSGAVSFYATSDSGDKGIFVAHGGTFTTIADNIAMGPCADYGTFTGISNEGSVMFHCSPNSPARPVTKDECEKGGWKTFTFLRTFKNQGDCVQFVNTGK